jgi:hypothetical protein
MTLLQVVVQFRSPSGLPHIHNLYSEILGIGTTPHNNVDLVTSHESQSVTVLGKLAYIIITIPSH